MDLFTKQQTLREEHLERGAHMTSSVDLSGIKLFLNCSRNFILIECPILNFLNIKSLEALEFFLKFLSFFLSEILFIYFREGKGEGKKGRETSLCGCLSRAPHWGPRQPRHVT